MNVKQRLLDAHLGLVESDFHTYHSDLYVIDKGVYEWLRENYEWFCNVKKFLASPQSDWTGIWCVEIPFANHEYWQQSLSSYYLDVKGRKKGKRKKNKGAPAYQGGNK